MCMSDSKPGYKVLLEKNLFSSCVLYGNRHNLLFGGPDGDDFLLAVLNCIP